MKCLVFQGDSISTVDEYNNWAKNKVLARDVIIHTHATLETIDVPNQLMILVFFDERIHTDWSPTETCPNMAGATRGAE